MVVNTSDSGAHAKYGQRLIPSIIDDVAREDPDRVYAKISIDSRSFAQGSKTVTYAHLARAIDRFAWFLEKTLGRSEKNDTLSYIGVNDIRYLIGVIGAMKAGYQLLLPSPRNSTSNHLHLIEKTHCSNILKDESVHVDHIISACPTPLHVIDIPPVDYFLEDGSYERYPWNAHYNDIVNRTCVTLHSSGSTGQVKPIPITHGSLAAMDRQHFLRNEPGFSPLFTTFGADGSKTIFIPMPFFHAAGQFVGLAMCVFYHVALVMPPVAAPLNVATVTDTIDRVQPSYAMMAPSILEEMTEDPKALESLGKPEIVCYAGGALSDYAGDIIARHARLQSYIGTTEAGAYPVYTLDDPKHDYPYIRLDPELKDIEFRHHDADIYKMVLVRPSESQVVWSSIFDTFPDKTEYDTSDLWRKHPTKVGYWKHTGRADDVIVLSNGEKVVPSAMESVLHQSPDLHEVILYGQRRFQVAAIVELEIEAQNLDHKEALKRLEPFIKKANENVPSHARLSTDRIIFTTPEKPLSRTGKGTVARKATFQNFEMELDQLYSSSGDAKVLSSPLIKDVDHATTVKGLSELFAGIGEMANLEADKDFLTAGVDSLKIITLVRNIKAQLEAEKAEVPLNGVNTTLLYSHPTLNQLATALRNLTSIVSDEAQAAQRAKAMEDMFDKYSANLPAAPSGAPPARKDNLTVVLTGSTGSLGNYLLANLLANRKVAHIHCLNRSVEARSAQTNALKARDLPADFGDRVSFHHMDVGKPHLGLSDDVYDDLVAKVDVFVHNAWPVNFNMSLASFEAHIAGMRRVIDLVAAAPNRPSLLFTSSIGTVHNWPAVHPDLPIPEHIIGESQIPGNNGYGESKWIGERILAHAARVSGVRAVNVHVGQMAGAVTSRSVWNKWEWFPSIIASSAFLGKLPGTLGTMTGVDFVPLEHSASILLELALGAASRSETEDPDLVFNMVNPHHQPYEPFVPVIADRLHRATGRDIEIVSFSNWLQVLKKSAKGLSDADVEKNPAVKLADYFDQMVPSDVVPSTTAPQEEKGFDTAKTKEHSSTMRHLEGVKQEWVEVWLTGWGF